MSGAKRSPLRSWAMTALIVLALGYLVQALWSNAADTLDELGRMNPWRLGLSILPFTAMYAFKALYHWLIVRRLGDGAPEFWAVLDAYCQAQVVRYLPGKVWGIVYQASRLRASVPAQHVVIANVVQLLNTQLYTVFVCSAIVLAQVTGHAAWLLLLALGTVAIGVLHATALMERGSLALAARLSRQPMPLPESLHTPATVPVVALLSLEWIAFFAGWGLLCDPALSLGAMIALGACYSVAALLATLAIVVPAGLAVREALFVSIGQRLDFDLEQLLVYGVIARLVLTVAEVACMLAVHAIRRRLAAAAP